MTDARLPTRRPFQFRLRTLLVLTTVTAMALAGLCSPSPEVRSLTADGIMLGLATVFLTLVAFGQGYQRAFCLGALVPIVVPLEGFVRHLVFEIIDLIRRDANGYSIPDPGTYLTVPHLAVTVLLCIATGLLAVLVRWLIESPSSPTPSSPTSAPPDPARPEPTSVPDHPPRALQ